MAKVELIMPKMGESIMEATILKWVKQVGERVEADETILEIATDKVDSEVPSPASGIVEAIWFQENETVAVGKTVAVINTEAVGVAGELAPAAPSATENPMVGNAAAASDVPTRFYSPLVRNMAKEENISLQELEALEGTGENGRVTKYDVLQYLRQRQPAVQTPVVVQPPALAVPPPSDARPAAPNARPSALTPPAVERGGNVELIEMDRMRRLIADHMVMSKQVSPHVTSFVEADVTNLVKWRERNKDQYAKKYGEKITFTPLFVEAVVKALKDFPLVNVSVDGTTIIRHKDIHIGMAAALPTGNLIVPVIKNADLMNLVGLTKQVNDLANRARLNQLKPEEIKGGTFTITNVGTFGNIAGTPIINQPQAAILALGAIRKKPAVLETEYGDIIAVRQLTILSLAYDHRIIDGFLGGSFLRRIADYLEAFDPKREV